MKKSIIIIGAIFLVNLSLMGQDFISEKKEWNVLLMIDLSTVMTEIFKIEGDSLVDSVPYKKIWFSNDSLSSWDFSGLLREDSNIVYYIPPYANEGILYDFNLEVGDTAFVKNMFCVDDEIPVHVIDIDTVEYYGISRKRWHLGEDGFVEEYWVEGIGSLNGPLYTKYWYCMICPVWELLCYHDNGTLNYMMPGVPGCYLNTVGINEDHSDIVISVRPNPVRKGSDIYIETTSKPNNISIYNASGLLVKRINPAGDHLIRIETDTFKSGLYFIAVRTDENQIITEKVLIE